MNLSQFKSWKLLYEDDDMCFSKAVDSTNQTNVFFISIFSPQNVSIATRHLIEGHLYNYIGLIEEDEKLHLVLKQQHGISLSKLLKTSTLNYEDRIQLIYEYLKLIIPYDAFPDAIKIQLLDEDQLLIADEGLTFRELIDYTASDQYGEKDHFKQLGRTIDRVLSDAEGFHSQFIDNLIIGNHTYTTLESLKNHYKDVFIFEKPEALDKINTEYTIIINDLEAGPPIKSKTEIVRKPSNNEIPLAEALEDQIEPIETEGVKSSPSGITSDTLSHENLQQELLNLLKESPAASVSEPSETVSETISEIAEPMVQTDEQVVPVETPFVAQQNNTYESSSHSTTTTFRALFEEEADLPEALPKSTKQRDMEDDEDLLEADMSDIFDLDEENAQPKWIIKWPMVIMVVALLLVILFIGIKVFAKDDPVSAKFEIEPLRDNRIAFMNVSTGEKHIEAYSWEIYYDDMLVQTFTDKNLFPVFDTEGQYTIVLKVQDDEGNWSEPFTEHYVFSQDETTENP